MTPALALDLGLELRVQVIEIEGNSVLPAAELETVAASYVGRMLVNEDLLDLQRKLTRLYVEAGYATSFAMLPDQDLAGGTLRVRIVEGRIGDVVISGLVGFDAGYLEKRIVPDRAAPLDVAALERRLQIIQLDPRIDAVRAKVSSGPRPGEALLEVTIVEAPRWRAQTAVSNDRPTSIGETNVRLGASRANLLGRGDDVAVSAAFSSGLREVVVDAGIPITRHDTTLSTRFRYSDSTVVAPLFADLDIESSFWSVGLALSQPIYRSPRISWKAGFLAELRESQSTIGGAPFPTSEASPDGQLRVAVFRFSTEASYRDAVQVWAARTMLSVGAPILGAAETPSGVDDSDFVSWLGQLQWARRFGLRDIELFARLDWQLAWDPLPPFERFAVGGIRTVRGYAENRLVRDNGITGSVELRMPIVKATDGRSLLAIAPFVDAGRAWFRERGPTPDPRNLASVGIGVLSNPRPWVSTYLYWGAQLIAVPETASSLQDQGIHFGVTLSTF